MKRDEVEGLIAMHAAELAAYPVVLVGVRGYYKRTMGDPEANDRGIYDDAIFLLGPGVFLAVNANTDPSRYTPGVASMIAGVHLYRQGKHGITTHADGGYPAFRPANAEERVPVTRDGQKGQKWGIAINIHKGGYNTTSSLGCQTVFPDQWRDFQVKTYAAMDAVKQRQVPYVLIEG